MMMMMMMMNNIQHCLTRHCLIAVATCHYFISLLTVLGIATINLLLILCAGSACIVERLLVLRLGWSSWPMATQSSWLIDTSAVRSKD